MALTIAPEIEVLKGFGVCSHGGKKCLNLNDEVWEKYTMKKKKRVILWVKPCGSILKLSSWKYITKLAHAYSISAHKVWEESLLFRHREKCKWDKLSHHFKPVSGSGFSLSASLLWCLQRVHKTDDVQPSGKSHASSHKSQVVGLRLWCYQTSVSRVS